MQGKTVINPYGVEHTKKDFENLNNEYTWTDKMVFGEWREKREPRRCYRVESHDGRLLTGVYDTEDRARNVACDNERIVEFVEVAK